MPVIKTNNFTLRPYRPADAPSLAKNINNYKIYRYTAQIPFSYSLKDARIYLKRVTREMKAGTVLSLAIIKNRKVIGAVSLNKIIKHHRAELGYWLAEEYWQQGIVSQAVKLIVAYGFKCLKLIRIYAYVMSPNKASMKVLKNNGFKKEGILKRHSVKDDRCSDLYVFAKVKR